MHEKKISVLLHICCGICAAECINRLKLLGYNVVGFFYNPNIHPEEEYYKRKKIVEEVANIFKISLLESKYEPEIWFSKCESYSLEPEGGKRCEICYELRLKETSILAEKLGYEFFTTTLTISPHKNSHTIFLIGERINKNKFLKIDFKKQNGFNKTIQFAKNYKLYRQNYCGCIYSRTKNLLNI
ncbi:MAG: epoxyqueuosine reductase QueH [Endomicrobia bacterium]|nr:epoxyqueuosine reductase QueH [Endomicrobiia bacterium]